MTHDKRRDDKPIAVTVTVKSGDQIISHHGALLCAEGRGDTVGFPTREPDAKPETWVWVRVAQ